MKHTIKLLTLAAILTAVFGLTGCPGPVNTVDVWDNGVVTTEPTCTAEGVKTYTCSNGETRTESIPALGHDMGEWLVITPATCTTNGSKRRVCSRCEHEETETILAHHHIDYETSGYCETCGVYKFEDNHYTIKVFTSTEEWQKVHPNVNLMATMQNSEPVYEDCKFSFETNSIPTNLNELIHLKSKYNGYRVYKFFLNGRVFTYTEDIENEGVGIMNNMDILLSQN